jgi:hypothetical protein
MIIESMRSKTLNYVPPPFVPVWNFNEYLVDKARTEYRVLTSLDPTKHNIPQLLKESDDNLAIIAQQHRDTVYVEPLNEKEKKREPPKDYSAKPIEYLYVQYFNKGIKPPITVYLKQLKLLGYSDEALTRILEKHEQMIAQKPALEEFINSVFGDDSSKKNKKKVKPS